MKRIILASITGALLCSSLPAKAEIDPFATRHDLYVHAAGGAILYTTSRAVFQNMGANDTEAAVFALFLAALAGVYHEGRQVGTKGDASSEDALYTFYGAALTATASVNWRF